MNMQLQRIFDDIRSHLDSMGETASSIMSMSDVNLDTSGLDDFYSSLSLEFSKKEDAIDNFLALLEDFDIYIQNRAFQMGFRLALSNTRNRDISNALPDQLSDWTGELVSEQSQKHLKAIENTLTTYQCRYTDEQMNNLRKYFEAYLENMKKEHMAYSLVGYFLFAYMAYDTPTENDPILVDLYNQVCAKLLH